MTSSTQLPDRLFFKIGEVADLVGVKPHVLRYWESEFAALAPKKTRGSHRQYSRKDVELAMHIRQLLHDEGFTIAGAKRRLKETGLHKRKSPSAPRAAREVALRAELLGLREQLVSLLDDLDAVDAETVDEAPAEVKVEAVVHASSRSRKR